MYNYTESITAKMSKPRTRSQGPPDVDSREEDQPSTAQRRMSRELMVRLETLRLLPARSSEGGETSLLQEQTATKTVRPASMTLRPPSTIPPASRPNSVMGIQTTREVSTKFSRYHVVPMHNSTAKDWKQNRITSLVQPRPEDMGETDLEVAEIVEGTTSNRNTSELRIEATPQILVLYIAETKLSSDRWSEHNRQHSQPYPPIS